MPRGCSVAGFGHSTAAVVEESRAAVVEVVMAAGVAVAAVAVDGVRLAAVLHSLVAVSRSAKPSEKPVELQFQRLGQGCVLWDHKC